MSLTPTRDFRRGLIYKVDPWQFHVRCNDCGRVYIGSIPMPATELNCYNCGGVSNPEHTHQGYRPFLIIQDEKYTPALTTISCVPVTSQLSARGKIGAVAVPCGTVAGLPSSSFILTWQVRTLNKNSFFNEKIVGELPRPLLRKVTLWLRRFGRLG